MAELLDHDRWIFVNTVAGIGCAPSSVVANLPPSGFLRTTRIMQTKPTMTEVDRAVADIHARLLRGDGRVVVIEFWPTTPWCQARGCRSRSSAGARSDAG